jgi:hypothetical protein
VLTGTKVHILLNWHKSTSTDATKALRQAGVVLQLPVVCSRMLTYAHVCCARLVACCSFQSYAHVCSRMLTHAHACSHMLRQAGVVLQLPVVCSRMLTYAHVCCARLVACCSFQSEKKKLREAFVAGTLLTLLALLSTKVHVC